MEVQVSTLQMSMRYLTSVKRLFHAKHVEWNLYIQTYMELGCYCMQLVAQISKTNLN